MAAQKAWRLQIAATESSFVQVVELAFLDAAGTDLSLGGVAIASSQFSVAFAPANAFDKDLGTRWATQSEQFPGWVGYIHTTPVDATAARVTWNTTSIPLAISDVTVSSSTDGAVWDSPMRVALVSGSLTAGATCLFVFLTPKPLIVLDLPPPTHVPTLAYTGPYGHAVTLPAPLHAGEYRTPPLGTHTGTVYGTTAVKTDPLDKPVRARVLLLREKDGKVIREMWSDPATGAYRFEDVDTGEAYTVLTYHPTRDKRAVVADGIIPEVLP